MIRVPPASSGEQVALRNAQMRWGFDFSQILGPEDYFVALIDGEPTLMFPASTARKLAIITPDHEHTQERHWLRKSSPHLLLWPDHAHLWQGDHPHVPHLDHATRTCACACGHPLPGPTLGHMEAAWVDHARELLKES